MQSFKLFFLSAVIAPALFGIDLQFATNQQLLDEVSRRMGGTSPGGTAVASYLCDSAYLKVLLIGEKATGNTTVYLGDYDKCLQQSNSLGKYKSKIATLTLIAICDSAYLKRYSLHPSGELKTVDSVYMGDYDKCIAQAKQINEN